MKPLRKKISRYMQIVSTMIAISILISVFLILTLREQEYARAQTNIILVQIEQLLQENQQDLERVQKEYHDACLLNAETIAYIIESNPEILDSQEELKQIAEMTGVDEIHIFDSTGRIFTGTHPEYYDMTFESGAQIGFFAPLLTDRSLKLCQEITPNTAEARLMQYSALWSENERFIVQVGMEPINVMRVTEKNELSYIFSLLRVNVGVNLYAIDVSSGEIVGTTAPEQLGHNAEDIGLDLNVLKKDMDGFHATVNGVNSFCIFRLHGNNLIGRTISNATMYHQIPGLVTGLTLCVILLVSVLVLAVSKYVNYYIVDGITSINTTLRSIGEGNLQEQVKVHSSLEFSELSSHINEMLKSLIDNNKKMSYVLSKTNLFIGVYEYNKHLSKVRYTEYLPRILGIDSGQLDFLALDRVQFEEFIDSIKKIPFPEEEGIYIIGDKNERYVRLEEIHEEDSIFGVLIDMTEELQKRRLVESERDLDTLTGLYNRRGIDRKLEELFKNTKALKYGALIIIDADDLKSINDRYGHEKGDVYLKEIANTICSDEHEQFIAARHGGDEYTLFLYGYSSEKALLDTIDKLRRKQCGGNAAAMLSWIKISPFHFAFPLVSASLLDALIIQKC